MTCHGSCHCGSVQIACEQEPAEVTECNCSICRRLGSLWHYGAPSEITVTGQVQGYVQGDCSLTTWRCVTCGCVTHWTAMDESYGRMGMNLRMFEPDLWRELPKRFVDGASF